MSIFINTASSKSETKMNNIDLELINQVANPLNLNPNHKLYIALAKKDSIDFVYNTSALEGNAMTYPEVQTLLSGITVGGHKLSDEQMILNQNQSLSLLFELLAKNDFALNQKTLFALHTKVAFQDALLWGAFRDTSVNIGGTDYKPPQAEQLESIFQQGIAAIKVIDDPLKQALVYLLFGSKNQFFYDGNKRVSRLIANGILLQSGYPILNIKAKDALAYHKMMLNFYDSDKIVPALEYLINYYIKQNSHLIKE